MMDVSTKLAILRFGSQMATLARIPQLLHRCFFQNKLAILVYHAVVRSPLDVYNTCFLNESSFRSQVSYLKSHFDVLSLSEAVEKMRGGEISRPTAVITFDDGFQNNYDVAFPILRELALPATIFLTTALVNTDNTFWYLRLNRALAKTRKPSLQWDGRRFDLSGSDSKLKTEVAIRTSIRDLPRPKLLEELRRVIVETGDDLDCPIEADSPFRMLDAPSIAEMTRSGLVEFGAHSHTHPWMSRLSSKECQEEISLSVAKTHELTGRPCELFAYPFGYPRHYNSETIRTLKQHGIRIAVTGVPGPNDETTSLMEMRRYGIDANDTMAFFQVKAHHLISYVPRFKR
jgi:peptidoglycan/xylan/chitin deacetylase (PgdA/CDA1 family)